MADTILDKLDADPGGARKYLAACYSYGASHEQAAEKLAEKFGLPKVPSKRILGEWRRNDAQLIALIDELESVRRDMNPDASPADVLANIPAPVDPAEAATDYFNLLDAHPAYAALANRCHLDDDFPDDVALQVLRDSADDTDEEFEARCAELVGDWNVHVALGADPADVARVERAMAERAAA